MKRATMVLRVAALAAALLALAAAAELLESQMQSVRYPEPRFPSYLKPPKSVNDVLPAARLIVRNRGGIQGAGMGILARGDSVLLVPTVDSEELMLQALQQALEERGVKVVIQPDYQLVGVGKQDALALRKARRTFTAEKGYMEAAEWIETQFPDPDAAKNWLKGKRPDLYPLLFPQSRELSPHLKSVWTKLELDSVGKGIREYLQKHPEIKGAYWGKGGSTGLRRAMDPLQDKFLGIFWADNRWEVMSQIGSYPADVWQLTEEKTLEPIAYADKIHAADPEGTDISADVNEIQAQRWAQGSYQRGHLYMFPNQATGRFGYSVVDYPAFQKEYLPREPMVRAEGVVAGTKGHGGFFPRWEVHFKNGYISEVKGGGLYGDVLREFLKYPKIQELTYPFHSNPGFWYLYEVAFGTHPKYFRNPWNMENGNILPDRLRAAVIHWGLGIRLWHDPDAPVESKSWLKFTSEHNLPKDHNFHTHTYFTTYRVRIRGADRWMTLLDRGHMTGLDDPEVRALASR
ncbi:MAG: hypothetical protein HY315_04065, partial [Acidobacteria bacterium]|nr:hypothetical protein [Acidobacteriota bacterium]